MATKYNNVPGGEAATGVNQKLLDCKDFSAEGLHASETINYRWFAADDAAKHYEVTGTDQSGSASTKQFKWTEKTLKERLEKANISTTAFGEGKAKTLKELCSEIQNGECSLMHDTDGSFTSTKIVRVVEVVCLRITNKSSVLIESKEQYADGRNVERNRLPGAKQRPNENVKATTERIMESLLGFKSKGKITFAYDSSELIEEKEDSPSYPGVVTVYRKTIVSGQVLPYSMQANEYEGIGGDKCSPFTTTGPKGETKHWSWCTAKDIKAKKIKIEGKKERDQMSGLVAAQIKMEEDSLVTLLQEHGINAAELYGKGEAKSLYEFSQEIARGESYLQSDDGKLVRIVDVVLLKVKDSVSNKILLEVSRSNDKTGSSRKKEQLPGAKSRPNENIYATARRICNVLLGIRDEFLVFGGHTLIEEQTTSKGYPGMSTCYRKHIIDASVEK